VELAASIIGVIVGFGLSEVRNWWRDKTRADQTRRLLAGALATELRAFKNACPGDEQGVITWCVGASCLSVYDSAAGSLYLLGPDLMSDVVTCYFGVKRLLDEFARAQRMTEEVLAHPRTDRGSKNWGEPNATKARNEAVKNAHPVLRAIEKLTPRLDDIAKAPSRSTGDSP
jgi:hypothetical protein